MENQKKDFKKHWKGAFALIARKVGCSPKYVSLVLRDKLGKYNERDTRLVKKIRKLYEEFEAMLES